MKQILHIFAKDVRRLWPEILISLATLSAFVWIFPSEWGVRSVVLPQFRWLPGATVFLVIFGWLLMITRDIHGETLVGERQFWITRPYRWPLLLGAKALFLFVFLLFPFFLVQLILLHIAGFPALPSLPGVAWNMLFLVAIAVVPMAAIATMTSNFGRMLLGILFVILYIGLVAYIDSRLPTSGFADDYMGTLTSLVLLGVLITVIVLQYAQRRTGLSRLLTAGMALIIGLLTLFGPENLPMRLSYPSQAGSAAVSVDIAFKPEAKKSEDHPFVFDDKREIALNVPLKIGGIQSRTAIREDYAKVEITSASGERWVSHWQSIHSDWGPATTQASLGLKISNAFYERAKGKPVTASITLAMTALEAGKTAYTTMPSGKLALAGGGTCSLSEWGGLSCLAPLRPPALMLAVVQASQSKCFQGEPRDDEGGYGETWVGMPNPSVEFGLTPIWRSYINFQFRALDENHRAYICAGAPLSFTPYSVVWKGQRKVPIGVINLQDYAYRNTRY
ncbi:hypothetical protein SAMN05421770_103109 [Granulicella rosea]|uniref:ABC-type transport system involved in multi-copper enzyme maturation, permease component n=1 Tax=Granulicella rosea TaxID=474952 RepID=A0A239IIP6_9BACT|nr:hypothetical protein [Granulicella rosea]SNS92883.1 hypothetical protein SAMN05421770_103109 [Granulicella rosea]